MKSITTLLVFCAAALVSLGLVMLYSAGMWKGEQAVQYFIKQLIWCSLGLIACFAATVIDYKIIRALAWVLFFVSVALLALVFVPPLGHKSGGAWRWIRYGNIGFQPSEFAKLGLMAVIAWYGERYQHRMRTFWRGLVVPALPIGLILGMIFIEPDVGTTILLAAVSSAMLLVAGIRWTHFVPPVAVVAAAMVFFLCHDPMRSSRIHSWLHLEETKLGKGMQAWQARVALGSGGWNGLGLGNGRQKLGFVPEHDTDFIFSVIGEELGLIATLAVVTVFAVLTGCGIYISLRAREPFGMILGSGITLLIGFQAFINIGVVTGTLPNKGLPLPFISYGGSNLLLEMTLIGILLSIARRAPERDAAPANPFDSREVIASQWT